MKRVGYDSDTGRYYFRDREGILYEGAQGAEFSEMTRGEVHRLLDRYLVYYIFPLTFRTVSGAPIAITDESSDEDLEAAPTRSDGYQSLATESVSQRQESYPLRRSSLVATGCHTQPALQ